MGRRQFEIWPKDYGDFATLPHVGLHPFSWTGELSVSRTRSTRALAIARTTRACRVLCPVQSCVVVKHFLAQSDSAVDSEREAKSKVHDAVVSKAPVPYFEF